MTAHCEAFRHPAGVAFDSIAESYDDVFTRSLIGRAQRDAVWEVLQETFRRGDYVLELNCGTGEDALYLARQGVSVFACDASRKMIQIARRRCEVEASELPLWFEALPTEQIDQLQSVGPFDGVFSNFSGLNCVADIGGVAFMLSTLVKPGGTLLLCISTRVCLWETLWYMGKADPSRASRRWSGRSRAMLGGVEVEVQYPTLRQIRKLFSRHFVLRFIQGIGVAVPPSYAERVAQKYPKALGWVQALDRVIGSWYGFRVIGDHVLLRFEKASP